MRAFLLFSTLLLLTTCLTTYTDSFLINAFDSKYRSYFSIGYLNAGDQVGVLMTFPSPSGATSYNKFKVRLYRGTSHIFVTPQPGTFDATYTFPTVPGQIGPIGGKVVAAGSYNIRLDRNNFKVLPDSIEVIEITITINGIVRPSNRLVQFPRARPFKMFYLMSQQTVQITNTGKSTLVYKMDNSRTRMQSLVVNNVGQSVISTSLGPGYYVILFGFESNDHQNRLEQVSYQSDIFPCPYSSSFTDRNGIFKPCYHQLGSNCPTGQYFSGGRCWCNHPYQIVSLGQCVCHYGTTFLNGGCWCTGGKRMVDGFCACTSGRNSVNGDCLCDYQYGLVQVNGVCKCPSNQVTLHTGYCGCPDDQFFSDQGRCECKNGQVMQTYGVCSSCPQGQIVSAQGKCACPAGQFVSNGGCQCLYRGQQWINGKCSCGAGKYLKDGRCEDNLSCPFGFQFDEGDCICPPGKKVVNLHCVVDTTFTGNNNNNQNNNNQNNNNNQQVFCPAGYDMLGGVCQPLACDPGLHLQNGYCQCPQGVTSDSCGCPPGHRLQNGVCIKR